MKPKLFLIAGAVLASTSSWAAAAPPVAPSQSRGMIQNAQYYYYDHPRSPHYWQRGGYDPWVWRYRRHLPSRQRDFYGSPSFHGG